VQLFRASELIAPDDPRIETFRQIELPLTEWERLLDEVAALGIPVLADVFDRPSLGLGESGGVQAYKIHSTDMENPEFIRAVAATGKPLLLSTGGCDLQDVSRAIEGAEAEGNEQIMLLHGVQNFPTRVEDSHLRYMGTLKETFGLPVGFLDHVDGGSPMALVLPALALAFGADLIEKHMTLDRAAKGFDYESALEPEVFRQMVEQLRETEKAFGNSVEPQEESAERYHQLMRRAVLSRVPLRKGEPLRPEQLVFLRNEKGLAPKNVAFIVGRKPNQDIEAWQPLTEDLFE
jgi:sialic acid synthase SpsE